MHIKEYDHIDETLTVLNKRLRYVKCLVFKIEFVENSIKP